MCLNPITIYNKSKYLNPSQSQLTVQVPCGHCAECEKEKQSEYALRAYYEYLEASDAGGFTYFDTFTYSDANLPVTLGIPHFSIEHYQKFFKLLRIRLQRFFGFLPHELTYLWVSEYGGIRHRPHYHALFFIKCRNKITPRQFQRLLHKCWPYGITDQNHVLRPEQGVVTGQQAIGYVTKYVIKDDDYTKIVDAKWKKLANNEFTGIKTKVKLERLKKEWKPFNRHSKGFGLYCLNCLDFKDIFETGMLSMPDKKFINKHIPLPIYFKRKLFYQLEKREDGSLHWKLNSDGIDFKLYRLDDSIKYLADKYQAIYDNAKQYCPSELPKDNIQQIIDKYLDGRSFKDFVIYLRFYKGRLFKPFWTPNGFVPPLLRDYRDIYLDDLTEQNCSLLNPNYNDDIVLRNSSRSNLRAKSIKQTTYKQFRYFDDLFTVFNLLTSNLSDGLQAAYQKKKEIKSRLKAA